MTLNVQDLTFRYASEPVLQDVSFTASAGRTVAILGVNGAGKSTLLKCLGRLLPHCTGTISLDDREINRLTNAQRARKIAFVPQFPDLSELTVFDTVLLGRRPHLTWEATPRDLQLVERMLQEMNLSHLALRTAATLSGGEQQQVALARALVQQPQVLLCDEPTSNLDLHNQLEVVRLLRSLAHQQSMLVMATVHDLNLALRFADDFIFLKDHAILAAGDRSIITAELLQQVYDVPVRILQTDDETMTVIPL